MPSVWNEILYHFDFALFLCSKFPYSTRGNQRVNWAASLLPVQMSYHWCWAGKAPQWQSALTHWLYVCTLLGEGLLQPRGGRCKEKEKSAQTPSGDTRYTSLPLCSSHLWGKCCTCTCCRATAEVCMGTQRIPVPKAFGCSHHRLPPKAHSSSSDLPRGRNGACGSAGNEPKSGLSSALELAFAMLPYNTKLGSLGKALLQDFHFIWLHLKLAYTRHVGNKKSRKSTEKPAIKLRLTWQ